MFTYGGLEVYETKGANHDDYASNEDVCNWTRGGPFSNVIEGFRETTH